MSDSTLKWDSLKQIHDHFASIAAGICSEGKEVAPQLFFVEVTPDGGMKKVVAMPPKDVRSFFKNNASKDAYGTMLRAALTEGSVFRRAFAAQMGFAPDVLVQINEAWMALPDKKADLAELLNSTTHVFDMPDKFEVILLVLHTPGLSIPVMHRIETSPSRQCKLSPFPLEAQLLQSTGRLMMQDSMRPTGGPLH